MKVVADTNRIVAALLKDGTTRKILSDENFEIITPDYTITEIEEHKSELQKIAKMTDDEFRIHLALVFSYIKIIPEPDYKNFVEVCRNDISDPDDVPILATAIASSADAIWAHDPHFNEQKKVKVFTNIDMLRMSRKNKIDQADEFLSADTLKTAAFRQQMKLNVSEMLCSRKPTPLGVGHIRAYHNLKKQSYW